MGWEILASDQTSVGEKVVAAAYVTGEAVAHGMVIVYGGAVACGYASAACYQALTTGGGLLGAFCRYGECSDTIKAFGETADKVFDSTSNRPDNNTFDPILELYNDPWQLFGKNPQDIPDIINWATENGWRVETLGDGGHKGQGFILREYTSDGKLTGKFIQWHPGGGHHGPEPYWKLVSPETGKKWIGPQFEIQ